MKVRRVLQVCGGVAASLLMAVVLGCVTLGGNQPLLPASQVGPPPAATASRPAPGPVPVPAQFVHFALNALLVPLLDDDEQPRWTDVALNHFCGPATRVEVNGQPLVPGAPMPATAFTVRWTIDQCWPLDVESIELSGTVDLLVSRDGHRLSAVVHAQGLTIVSSHGTSRPDAPFTASMTLGSDIAPQSP